MEIIQYFSQIPGQSFQRIYKANIVNNDVSPRKAEWVAAKKKGEKQIT